MAKENSFSAVGYFGGSTTKGNFDIQLKAKFSESDLQDALQFLVGIGKRLKLAAKVGEEKMNLGTFSVFSFKVDRDANTTIVFKSNIDLVKMENIPKLMVEEQEVEFKAMVIEE